MTPPSTRPRGTCTSVARENIGTPPCRPIEGARPAKHRRLGPSSGMQHPYGGQMLAADLARALDPALLAQAAGLDPDPWQRDVLRSAAPRVWLNCSRQSGKSS